MAQQTILATDDLNEGRVKINANFSELYDRVHNSVSVNAGFIELDMEGLPFKNFRIDAPVGSGTPEIIITNNPVDFECNLFLVTSTSIIFILSEFQFVPLNAQDGRFSGTQFTLNGACVLKFRGFTTSYIGNAKMVESASPTSASGL